MQVVLIHGLDSKEHVLSVNSELIQDGKNKMVLMMMMPPTWFESLISDVLCYVINVCESTKMSRI